MSRRTGQRLARVEEQLAALPRIDPQRLAIRAAIKRATDEELETVCDIARHVDGDLSRLTEEEKQTIHSILVTILARSQEEISDEQLRKLLEP